VDPDHLILLVERALAHRRLQRENLLLKSEVERHAGFPAIVGQSPLMQSVSEQVRKVAPTDATVLLAGESGTGKELFARAIHQLSKRREGPFVALNCAAIPETLIENELFGHEKGSYTGAHARQAGKFELAEGGTIFLDEIGELGKDVQGKILRVIQERTLERLGGTVTLKADVRIIAASNQDLRKAVEEGRFREDLFFRLNIFPITIPPLRHRTADIPLLADFFLRKFEGELGRKGLTLTPGAMERLQGYDWPGNVRELENALERAAILVHGKEIGAGEIVLFTDREALPGVGDLLNMEGTLPEAVARTVREVERWKVAQSLRETNGDRKAAAERLGITLKTLNSKLKDIEET
jgi:DNA-binding NtrC family response regulator